MLCTNYISSFLFILYIVSLQATCCLGLDVVCGDNKSNKNQNYIWLKTYVKAHKMRPVTKIFDRRLYLQIVELATTKKIRELSKPVFMVYHTQWAGDSSFYFDFCWALTWICLTNVSFYCENLLGFFHFPSLAGLDCLVWIDSNKAYSAFFCPEDGDVSQLVDVSKTLSSLSNLYSFKSYSIQVIRTFLLDT